MQSIPQTLAGSHDIATALAMAELASMGVDLTHALFVDKNIAYLAYNDPDLLDDIVTSIRESDKNTRAVWHHVLGSKKIASPSTNVSELQHDIHLKRQQKYCRLMIANAFMAPRLFPGIATQAQADLIAQLASKSEYTMNRFVGDSRYCEVHAAMIVDNIVPTLRVADTHGDAIMFIADNLDRVIPVIPALKERGQVYRELVEVLMDHRSVFADGLL